MEITVNNLEVEQAAEAWLSGKGSPEEAVLLARFARQTFTRTRSILDLTTIEEEEIESGTDVMCLLRNQINLRKNAVNYVAGDNSLGDPKIVEVSDQG